MAMIASVELEDDVAFRDGAGDADGAHRRLRPARDEAQHLDVRHAIDNQFAVIDKVPHRIRHNRLYIHASGEELVELGLELEGGALDVVV